MNIFKTHTCPILSAKDICNKLVIRMPTETSQLIATAFSLEQLSSTDCPKNKDGTNRKHFNPKHGSAIYTRNSFGNFLWVLYHGLALCEEYQVRYKKRHFNHDFLIWAQKNSGLIQFDKTEEEPIYLAMPDKYKTYPQDWMCYRAYINGEKTYSKWPSIDKIPSWFHSHTPEFVDKTFQNGQYTKR